MPWRGCVFVVSRDCAGRLWLVPLLCWRAVIICWTVEPVAAAELSQQRCLYASSWEDAMHTDCLPFINNYCQGVLLTLFNYSLPLKVYFLSEPHSAVRTIDGAHWLMAFRSWLWCWPYEMFGFLALSIWTRMARERGTNGPTTATRRKMKMRWKWETWIPNVYYQIPIKFSLSCRRRRRRRQTHSV